MRPEMLTAEIIAVGSELLTPFRTDTNSLWLTDRLNSVGVEVRLKTIVGDDDARLEETIRDALKRSGVVVITGGLGPTEDDSLQQHGDRDSPHGAGEDRAGGGASSRRAFRPDRRPARPRRLRLPRR